MTIALGAIMTGAAGYIPNGFPLAILGFVPITHSILTDSISWSRAFLFSFLYTGTALSAYWATLPLDWLGTKSWSWGVLLVAAQWSFATIPLSIALALSLYWVGMMTKRGGIGSTIVCTASAVTLVEYAEMWLYALVMHGPGIPLEPHFSAHMIGYNIATFHPFLMYARLGGVYALTWLTIILAGFITLFIVRPSLRHIPILLVTVIVVIGVFLGPDDTKSVTIRAAAVSVDSHGNRLGSHEKTTHVARTLNTLLVTETSLGLIVFPESLEVLSSPEGRNIAWSSDDPRLTIVDSLVATTSGKMTKRSLFYSPIRGARDEVNKSFLAPPREYVPYLMSWSDSARKISRVLGVVDMPRPSKVGGFSIGGSICLESMSPRQSRALVDNGAQILTNSSALGWFHGSRLVQRKVSLMNRVRAVETERYLIVAADSAPAEIFAPDGHIIAATDFGTTSVAVTNVALKDTKTLFVRLGDTILLLPLFILLSSFIILGRERHSHEMLSHNERRSGASA